MLDVEEKKDRIRRRHDEKKARLDHHFAVDLIKYQERTVLLSEIFRSNRTPEQVRETIPLIPTVPINQNNVPAPVHAPPRRTRPPSGMPADPNSPIDLEDC